MRRRRHHRRRFRHNPLGLRGGIVQRVTEGVKGAIGVVAGKVASRAIPTMIGLPRTGTMGIAVQALTGVVLAPFVGRMVGGDFGKAFLWGAFASPVESLVVRLNLPVVAPALSSYADEVAAIPYAPGAMSAALGAGMPGFTIDEEEAALVQ